jgi:hypothetical protein
VRIVWVYGDFSATLYSNIKIKLVEVHVSLLPPLFVITHIYYTQRFNIVSVTQQRVADISRQRPVFDARQDHIALVMDKVVLEHILIFSKYCCYPCQNHLI